MSRFCRRIFSHKGLISLIALSPDIGMAIYDDTEVTILGRVTEIKRKL